MVKISGIIGDLLIKKVSIGGTQIGMSDEGCFIVSQPTLKPAISSREWSNGFYMKIVCEDTENAYSFFSKLATKLTPHETTIEII
ncbi:MAG: hypothetical protein ACP5HH_00815 [Fervidicoccaceae archaeon]|jgi:hypothetical protein